MTEYLRNVIVAAQQLSAMEQLELIETISRSLHQHWPRLDGQNGRQSVSEAIPPSVKRTVPVTDLKHLVADFWPEDETADDINSFVEQQRKADLALEK